MTKTYTPLIIEGIIYVMERNTKYPAQYPVRPEHEEYWKNRIGKAITDVSFEYDGGISIAIPPQQKQGDEWDEADTKASEFASRTYSLKGNPARWSAQYTIYLRNNYSITKK